VKPRDFHQLSATYCASREQVALPHGPETLASGIELVGERQESSRAFNFGSGTNEGREFFGCHGIDRMPGAPSSNDIRRDTGR
jgi:hypothetical protein